MNSEKLFTLVISKPLDVSTNAPSEQLYKQIGSVKNIDSGDIVLFANTTLGKIKRHKIYDKRLIKSLSDLFENAVFLGKGIPDFDTPRTDGTLHKKQNNIEDYSYYLNKVRIDEKDYLIRFTVQNLKHKPWKEQMHIFHSQQLTQINKSGASNVSTLAMWADEVAASDLRLANLLRTVNKKI
ncbi:MAG: hypothetical protein IKZ79_05465 [Spirochaetia bacterium]|nr:hypothetical protein [Spirochaetia bacterium]